MLERITTSAFSLLLFPAILFGQVTISGTILDERGEPAIGANVFIKGTFDGASATADGSFSFVTELADTLVPVGLFISIGEQFDN